MLRRKKEKREEGRGWGRKGRRRKMLRRKKEKRGERMEGGKKRERGGWRMMM